jgi:DNA-binding GntR family transcriptional regulator
VYTEPSRSLADQAYADLKRRLLEGEFPLGRRLGEERLAALLSVSRTPVREALARLHAEGLVERNAEGGYSPARPQLEGIAELYEVRRGLELQALRRPSGRNERHDLDVLRSLRDDWVALAAEVPLPDPSFVLLDEDFHVRLALAAGNQALADVLVSVNERIRLVRMQDFLLVDRLEATIAQHVAIVEATLDGELVRAESALEGHLNESMTIVENRAIRALARMAGLLRDS